MDVAGLLFGGLEFIMREAAFLAAAGFFILGVGDLAVDLLWLGLRVARRTAARCVDDLPTSDEPGPLAIFVPAWDEAAVIGPMLRALLSAWDGSGYRVYVGCYPNDPATLSAVRAIRDERLRLVVGTRDGPTTKADCLNRLWEQLQADEAVEGRRAKAVVLHDAEDVVHPSELALHEALVGRFDLVQLPVHPLIDPGSPFISGHYADEFAEAHTKEMVVRQWLGASLPSAGVGCAFSRWALDEMAARSGGLPFDADSLTEDYELGLKIGEAGGQAVFVRIRDARGELVGTQEFFPATLRAAVRQKARWMTGIALSGWDRLGWRGGAAERWMRLRDRQTLLAALLLLSGYLAMALWLLLKLREGIAGPGLSPLPAGLTALVRLNMALLGWRLLLRCLFVTHVYGWREGLRAIPRAVVGNIITVLAAFAAIDRYRALRRTGRARWDKTDHIFPLERPAE